MRAYRDFELLLADYANNNGAESFTVRVLFSPHGEGTSADAVQIAPDFRDLCAKLAQRDLDAAQTVALGKSIGAMLLPGQAHDLLMQSLPDGDDQALRVKLQLDTQLANIPWEYAWFEPDGAPTTATGDLFFVGLQRKFSIVRHERLDQPLATLALTPAAQINLLVVDAAPDDLPDLNLAAERQGISAALAKAPRVNAVFCADATRAKLNAALVGDVGVFHFAGHGRFATGAAQGSIVLLANEQSRDPEEFPAQDLALVLRDRGVRLVVLNSCQGAQRDQLDVWNSVAAALASSGVPAIVGMQHSVADDCAAEFANTLYRLLAEGRAIDEAVAEARIAIHNLRPDDRDWGTPVLYLRTERDAPGALFPSAEPANWIELQQRARQQHDLALRALTGKPEQLDRAYMPEVYVARQAVEQRLDDFLAGERRALVLSGGSGTGKTNVLCRWTERLSQAGQAVFFYSCAGLEGAVEAQLAADLGITADDLQDKIAAIDAWADRGAKQFVLIFDGINEVAGPDQLMMKLDALLTWLPASARLVVSCSDPAWQRLTRPGGLSLHWQFYYMPDAPRTPVPMPPFGDDELSEAYGLYQGAFDVRSDLASLAPELKAQLKKPLLLRLLAITYSGRDEPVVFGNEALGLYSAFYDHQVQAGSAEDTLADGTAGKMWSDHETTVPKAGLVHSAEETAYAGLLERGVLVETPGHGFIREVVGFSATQLAAYLIARRVRDATGPNAPKVDAAMIGALLEAAPQFPLAWYIARALLLLEKSPDLTLSLATAANVDLRAMAVASLVQLQADEPDTALELLRGLLAAADPLAQRTALRAAVQIGSPARELFLAAAKSDAPDLRRFAKDILYLAGGSNPDFVYGILNDLTAHIGAGTLIGEALSHLRASGSGVNNPALQFFIELSVTIYINNCQSQDIIDWTDSVYFEVVKEKLHAGLLNAPLVGGALAALTGAVSSAFSRPIIEALLFGELQPLGDYFKRPAAARAVLKDMAAALDPAVDLATVRPQLIALLNSDTLADNVVAAHQLPIHAYDRGKFTATRQFIEGLLPDLNARGRLWALLSFAILVPDTPPEWGEFVERLTKQIIEQEPDSFYGNPLGFPDQFDIFLLPLALAHGKVAPDEAIPFVVTLIQGVVAAGDDKKLARCLIALGAAGFYYPQVALRTLRAAISDFSAATLRDALTQPLAAIATLHYDEVDAFLTEIGADEDFQHRLASATDVDLVQRYIWWLGLYNAVVYQVISYPKIRQGLSAKVLELLAEENDLDGVISKFTAAMLDMLRAADFHLKDWTR